MNIKIKNILLIFVSIFLACSDNVVENDKNPCPPIDIVAQPPYNNPIWHPSGKFIGFNYTPLDSITYPYGKNCIGVQHFNYDSTGFWLVNTDGTNMRRIFPYQLFLAAWSPDGRWIAFVNNAQIYKMPFNIDEERFDTTQIEQLTFEGKNFFPAWSFDGQWIVHDRTYAYPESSSVQGIWLLSTDGGTRNKVSTGRMPSWSPNGEDIIFIDQFNNIGIGIVRYERVTSTRSLLFNANESDIRCPKYSSDGTKIAFYSNHKIWLIDTAGANLMQMTPNSVDVDFGLPFSWSPDGEKIIYTQYNANNWNYDNGVLWIINTSTGAEFQLTFNTVKNSKK